MREIDPRQRVALDAPLTEVIHVLTQFSYCFVELDGAVVGVIGRGDIGKPVVRMWLFGIIILIEVQVVELMRARWPDGGWAALVSAGRMEKARQLQAERERRGLPADLLDCLQFSDKLQVAIQDREFVGDARLRLRERGEEGDQGPRVAPQQPGPRPGRDQPRLAADRPPRAAGAAAVRHVGREGMDALTYQRVSRMRTVRL